MNERHLKEGRYVLVRKLGEGSQGETYEAIDHGLTPPAPTPSSTRPHRLADQWERYVREAKRGPHVESARDYAPRGQRRVAIKCFRVGQAKVWKDVELAEREAETLAELDHPNLPKYIEHFEEGGALYLVMEKIEGESLAAIRGSTRRRPWSPDDVMRLLEDAADALRYLHAQSPVVVHRDIKPGNIIRRSNGSYAIVDFGSVRDRLKPGGGSTVVGTFGYMAPEQFQGRASPKSDVYGVAATALAMLTGMEPEDLPHEGLGIDVERAAPKGTPAGLVRALEAMLVPDPDARVESIDEALAFLEKGRRRAGREPNRRRSRKEERSQKRTARAQKRAARAEKKATRPARRRRAAPLVPRMIARLGLLIALLTVWFTVGIVVPTVLVVLSVLFGSGLRRAAGACVRATRRSQAAIDRASAWLSGDPSPPRVRVAAGAPRARIAAEGAESDESREVDASPIDEAVATGEAADDWLEERLHAEELRGEQRDRMRLHARPPAKGAADPKRRFWGR